MYNINQRFIPWIISGIYERRGGRKMKNILYATSEAGNQTLRVTRLDGSGNTVIAEGIYHALNLTSKYLYFKPFGVDSSTAAEFSRRLNRATILSATSLAFAES